MEYVVVKRLRQSELGWFEAYRRLKLETGRQRGLNFDAELVQEIFRPGDALVVPLRTRWWSGADIVEDERPLRLQQKNWRLVGTAVPGDRFGTIRPDDIVFLHIGAPADHAATMGDKTAPWSVTWDVMSQCDSQTASLFEMARGHLAGDSAALVRDGDADRLLRTARRRLPAFGGNPDADTAGMSDEDWERCIEWLNKWIPAKDLRTLVREGTSEGTASVMRALGMAPPKGDTNLAGRVLQLYGPELLKEEERRTLLAKARFQRRGANLPRVERWHPGGETAAHFVKELGLPDCMAGSPVTRAEDFEDIDAFQPLGALHDYQVQVAEGLKAVLSARGWEERRAIAWLPTGTGKTRVTVETLLMECKLDAPRNCVLWVADREELCEQAIETFRHVWMMMGRESRSCRNGVVPSLRVIRLWGGRHWQEPPTHPTVIVASIQTLATRLRDNEAFAEELAILGERSAAVVIDEAHHVVAGSYTRVIDALGLGRTKNYLQRNKTTAPPLIGLTATPARTSDDETERLSSRFHGRLIEPAKAFHSLRGFQESGYLSRVVVEEIKTHYEITLTDKERDQFEVFTTLPAKALRRVGEATDRTVRIIRRLEKELSRFQSVLVFACSIDHSHTIADALSLRGHRAAALDANTPRPVRWRTIERFRRREIKVLVNCELLATGFDAPGVDAVVLARPVESRILYAQMIGRGLRGPRNGGTPTCHVLDFQDDSRDFDLETLRQEFREQFRNAKGAE